MQLALALVISIYLIDLVSTRASNQQQSTERHMDFGLIQKLASCIVRPPKCCYSLAELGPTGFELRNRYYERQDFTVINNRGLELKCSFVKDKYAPVARETIIFLHANSSSRLIIKNYVEIFLPYFDLLSFDFAGCGLSEGQYVTLGYNEKEDLYSVISRVREKYGVREIILWGRSMGAATSLLYASKYGGVKAMVCDNCFSDLEELVNQLSDDYMPILPSFLVNSIIESIQEYIEENVWKKEMTKFNIRKLKPDQAVQKITCPIFFIGSIQDTFVNVRHTKRLHAKAKTHKKLELVNGDHNDARTDELKEKVLRFLIDLNLKSTDPGSVKERANIFKQPRLEKYRSKEENPSKSEQTISSPLHLDFTNHERQPRWKEVEPPVKEVYLSEVKRTMLEQIYSEQKHRKSLKESGQGRATSKAKRRKIFEGIDYINNRINISE